MQKSSIRKKRKHIIDNMKETRKEYASLLKEEPRKLKSLGYAFLISAIAMFIVEMVLVYFHNSLLWVIFGFLFLISFSLGIANILMDKKYKAFHKEKAKDVHDIGKIALQKEGDKYKVSPEIMALYLHKKYKEPLWLNVIINIISIASTAAAVYILPGYGETGGGIWWFVVLLILNLFFSVMANIICNEIRGLQNLDYYITQPFQEEFEKIDTNL